LNKVKVFWLYDVVIVVPKKESWAVKTVLAVNPGVWRTYVTHLGLVGEGVKVSNPGNEGGFPCLSHHGSWSRQIRFSVLWAKSCKAEIVVAWPLAQFSSCTDPTDAGRAILDSFHRFWGVSHGGCIRVYLGDFSKLNPFGTVGIACFMGRLTVGATNRGVSAGWTLLANRKSARVLLGLVGFCTNGTA
jgi:hypothetical protein